MKKILIPLTLLVFVLQVSSQDVDYARTIVRELSSAEYSGRGYNDKGLEKTAQFIASEYERIGLLAFKEAPGYLQEFDVSINVLYGKLALRAGDKELVPGHDFTVRPSSPPVKGTFELVHVSSESLKDGTAADWIATQNPAEKFVVMDYDFIIHHYKDFKDELEKVSKIKKAGVLYLTGEPLRYFPVRGRKVSKIPVINVQSSLISNDLKEISVNIKSRFMEDQPSQNVIGYIPGTKFPEKFFLVTAHHDHLGKLGKETYYAGADDNASGVAMLLDMASYFLAPENRPEYSIAFMACGSEEIGLLGSYYFTENPLVDPENIMMVLNYDMISFGNDGIKVINGVEMPETVDLLKNINDKYHYVPGIEAFKNVPHSDHYPFTQAGIKAIFLTTGTDAAKDYHTVKDVNEKAPLDRWDGIFRLSVDFMEDWAARDQKEISSK